MHKHYLAIYWSEYVTIKVNFDHCPANRKTDTPENQQANLSDI